jgi:hypothetical protein
LSRTKNNWRPFKEARAFVRSLGLKNEAEWYAWSKSGARPKDIPSTPIKVYRDKGWVSWRDWLGTDIIPYLPFEYARNFVHTLGLKNQNEWRNWTNRGAKPDEIPACPEQVYKDEGWLDLVDWLGTNSWRGDDLI